MFYKYTMWMDVYLFPRNIRPQSLRMRKRRCWLISLSTEKRRKGESVPKYLPEFTATLLFRTHSWFWTDVATRRMDVTTGCCC